MFAAFPVKVPVTPAAGGVVLIGAGVAVLLGAGVVLLAGVGFGFVEGFVVDVGFIILIGPPPPSSFPSSPPPEGIEGRVAVTVGIGAGLVAVGTGVGVVEVGLPILGVGCGWDGINPVVLPRCGGVTASTTPKPLTVPPTIRKKRLPNIWGTGAIVRFYGSAHWVSLATWGSYIPYIDNCTTFCNNCWPSPVDKPHSQQIDKESGEEG